MSARRRAISPRSIPPDGLRRGARLCSADACDPPVSLLLFRLVVVPFDGEEHARSQDENLQRKEDYREPIYPVHFEYFQAVTDAVCRKIYLKTAASAASFSLKALLAALCRNHPCCPYRTQTGRYGIMKKAYQAALLRHVASP